MTSCTAIATCFCYVLALLPLQRAANEISRRPVICPGRVLTTLKDVHNMNKENCTTIEGPLFIEDLDPEGSKQLYSLDTVEQITQFLVVQRIRASYTCLNQLLPRLRVIRGHHLYENQWSLVMRDNVHFFIDSVQRDMLKNSSRKLKKTFFPFVHNLLPGNGSFCNISNFKEPVSNLCLESQRPSLSASQRASQRPCLDTEVRCHQYCQNCTVVVEGWRCIPDGSCGNLSVSKLDWQMGKATVEAVPGVKSSQFATCLVPCKAPEGVVSDINELRYLQGCGVLEGNLQLSLSVSSVDMYFLENYLGSLEEIKGYLVVFRSWGMDSLQFLSNLTKLNTQGQLWQGRYALALYDNPDLSRLWKRVDSLRVSSGAVYLQGNPRLCSMDVETLNQSFPGHVYGDMALYTSATCSPWQLSIQRISPSGQRLYWNHTQNDLEFVGQIIYHTNYSKLEEMNAQVSGITPNLGLFQQWMTDRGSPGNLRGWHVIQNNASVLSNQSGKDADPQIFHIRVFGISDKQPELRSGVYLQPSSSMAKYNNNSVEFPCHQDLSSREALVISDYSSCCPSKNNSRNITIQWQAKPDRFQVELEYKEEGLDWTSSKLPFNDLNLGEKRCFRTCPILQTPHTSNNQKIPSDLSVVKEGDCKPIDRPVYSNTTHTSLQNLKPFTAYSVRIRKRFSKEDTTTCDPWSPPVLLLTAPSDKNDEAVNLRVIKGDDDDDITFSWQKPPRPNGGRVFHFCVAIMSDIEFDLSNIEFDLIGKAGNNKSESCIRSLRPRLIKRRTWTVVKMDVNDNNGDSFNVKLHIPEEPQNQGENITCLVQTISRINWTMGNATVKRDHLVSPEKDVDKSWVIAVSVCCVAICVLIPSLIVAVRYGRRKGKKAILLEHQIFFMNSNTYADLSLDEAYKPDEWEVDKECVTMHSTLGEGAFGRVFAGTLTDGKVQCNVAVKTLKDGASPAEKILFLTESSMMKKLDSDNVVRLLGIVSTSDPVLVLMELMANGDLKHYLQSIRPKEGRNEDGSYCCYPLPEDELIQLAIQIAAGMDYLHLKKFVHRDLAARNCMVAADPRVVKIGDFGMARDVYSTDYYIKHGQGPMPIRWMAPESLQDGIFSYPTDVWSYAVVLWEMVTLGSQPYPGKTNQEVFDFVLGGNLMDVKSLPHCPTIFMMLMERCWRTQPKQRPEFHKILAVISMDHGEEIKI